MKEALHYQGLAGRRVQCQLCPHQCELGDQGKGICGARQNQHGKLISLSYGQVAAIQLDPIEKKPLYHFYPGKNIVSVGSFGCNLHCSFCQNWTLSRGHQGRWQLKPEQLIKLVEEHFGEQDNIGLAFTYNEPLVGFEYLLEISKLAKRAGHQVVLISNGYINSSCLTQLLPHIDAMNIDLKSFREGFYQNHCQGSLNPVLENIKLASRELFLEVTTLLIPGENDSLQEIEELASWLGSVDKEIPLHLSRYFPSYQLERPPTDLAVMAEARRVAKRHLSYVYLGNAPQLGGTDTICPQCEQVLIKRSGYQVQKNKLESIDGQTICAVCHRRIRMKS